MNQIQIHSDKDTETAKAFESPKAFIEKCLTDLYWFETVVLSHKKKEEYKDLNHIHFLLCEFLDYDKNPILQKLIEMSRDSLKSTVMRGFVIQQILKALYHGYPLKIGIVTARTELSEDHLNRITKEILSNELIQAYFRGYVPTSRSDAESMTQQKVRYKGIEIDIGSWEKVLTGLHYDIVINDNFCDERNTATKELRRKGVTKWQQQESIIKQGAWELVFETPWEADDVSGRILDPSGDFDYEKNSTISPNIFISKTGYAVFSCFAKNEKGELNFPERLDEAYLERKRRKQGKYIYYRMYLGVLVAPEDREIERGWITENYYEESPKNFISNLVVDCSGTTAKQSTPSAISVMDTDEHGVGYIAYAKKKKVSLLDLETWLYEVIEQFEETNKRPITFIGVEKEKFGIAMCAILGKSSVRDRIWLIDIRGRPRHKRISQLFAPLEFGKLRSKKGVEFKQYEDEAEEYHEGTKKDVGILDTLAYQIEIQMIPEKMPDVDEYIPEDTDDSLLREIREKRDGLVNQAQSF